MIYELDKRGYSYFSRKQTLLGYFLNVKLKKGSINDEKVIDDSNDDYFKSINNDYTAYIFFKDNIDSNKKLKDFFMNIIFYLTKYYSSENCEKLENFFQEQTGYYLLIEKIKYDESPNLSDPIILRNCFCQINQELERRHTFGIYDSLFNMSDIGFKYLDENKNKFRVILKFQTFLGQLDFRYRGTISAIFDDLAESTMLDIELTNKILKLKEIFKDENEEKNVLFERYKNEFENIVYNITSKNELYNIGKMMLNCMDDDIEKIKDKNLKDLITSLLKENINERISWEDYINHPFFKNDSNNNNNENYKYNILKHFNIGYEYITNIIFLKDNKILFKENGENFYLIEENFKKMCEFIEKFEGYYLLNLDDLILIDDKEKKKIYFFKLKENKEPLKTEKKLEEEIKEKSCNNDEIKINKYIHFNEFFDEVQTIDINYTEILPLLYEPKYLVIGTDNHNITLWKNINLIYIKTLSFEIENNALALLEIKKTRGIVVCIKNKEKENEYLEEDKNYMLNFYEYNETGDYIKKGNIQNLRSVYQLCMINDHLFAYKDISNMLKIIDATSYQIIKLIMLETRHFNLFRNKFGNIMVGLLYEISDYSYTEFFKEYKFDNESINLIRKNTINGINPKCFAESDNNLIAFGTHNGQIFVLN